MKMKILGIDLSLTSPACCIFNGDELNIEQCRFYYLTSNKKLVGTNHLLTGTIITEYSSEIERFSNISGWIFDIIMNSEPDFIFIEDYSMASVGRVFSIAENCGILKYNLWKAGIPYNTIPPTVIKKQATGKGNANKAAMEVRFLEETGFNIREILKLSSNVSNPVSDIIDSYYIVKAGLYYEKSK